MKELIDAVLGAVRQWANARAEQRWANRYEHGGRSGILRYERWAAAR